MKRIRNMIAVLMAAALICSGTGCQTGVSGAQDLKRETGGKRLEIILQDRSETESEAVSETSSGDETGPEPETAPVPEPETSDSVQTFLDGMTLEEKVAQMFVLLPEALTGVGQVIAAGETTRAAIDRYPVGGLIYLAGNLESAGQVREMLANTQAYALERTGLPMFLCVDEEGGSVTRIGGTGKFDVPAIGDMRDVGASGDTQKAREAGSTIGSYLSDLGFNVDFAPVADVLTNPENQVVRLRSFGSDPELAARMCAAFREGLESQGVLSVYKHFPGHGATAGDTHEGYAYTDRTLDDLKASELIPFADGIASGVPMIMVSHISLPQVTGDEIPASVNPAIIRGLLRDEMGYDGLVITDSMAMGAIVDQYGSAEAAILTILAGSDLILSPADFASAYQGVLDAVGSGRISEERIDESVTRIIRVKMTLGE